MANVQIAVWFGWKTRMNTATVFAGGQIVFNNLFNKI